MADELLEQQSVVTPEPAPAPESTPSPAPAGEPPASPATPAPASGLRDLFTRHGAEYGFDPAAVADQDEEKLARGLLQAAAASRQIPQYQQQLQQLQQYQQQLAPMVQNWGAFQQWQAEQQKAQQQPAAEEPYWPKPPEWDEAWREFLTTDAEGNVVARPGARPDLPQLFSRYTEHQRNCLRKLVTDPWAAVQPAAEKWGKSILEQAKQEMQAMLQAAREEQFVNSVATDVQGDLFAVDPISGQRQPTPWGSAYMQWVQVLDQLKVPTVHQHALAMAATQHLRQPAGQQPQQAAAAPTPQQLRDDFRAPSGRPSNRNGAAAPDGTVPNPNADFRDMLCAAFKEKGYPTG
jgi:hypothetical protein